MSACECCWGCASIRAAANLVPTVEVYPAVVKEHERDGCECVPKHWRASAPEEGATDG